MMFLSFLTMKFFYLSCILTYPRRQSSEKVTQAKNNAFKKPGLHPDSMAVASSHNESKKQNTIRIKILKMKKGAKSNIEMLFKWAHNMLK